jgi:hypothetical protein
MGGDELVDRRVVLDQRLQCEVAVPAHGIGEHQQAQKAAERGEPNEHTAQPAASVRSGLLGEHGSGGLMAGARNTR